MFCGSLVPQCNVTTNSRIDRLPADNVKLLFLAFLHHPFTCFTDKRFVNWILRVASVHGQKAPLPFIKYVEVNLFLEIPYAYFPSTSKDLGICENHVLFHKYGLGSTPVTNFCSSFGSHSAGWHACHYMKRQGILVIPLFSFFTGVHSLIVQCCTVTGTE